MKYAPLLQFKDDRVFYTDQLKTIVYFMNNSAPSRLVDIQRDILDITIMTGLTCERPTTIPNANIESSGRHLGNTANYTCRKGTSFPNGSLWEVSVCADLAVWTQITGVCEDIDCGKPIDMANAKKSYNLTTFTKITTYTCEVGFRFPSRVISLQTMCTESGNWTKSSETCEEIDCGEPIDVANATKSYNLTTFGENTTYTCEFGFRFPSSVISLQTTCNNTGNWTKPSETCEEIDCGEPIDVANATKSYKLTTFGENTTYTCEVGFKFPSRVISLQTTCNNSGNWTKPSETCEVIDCGEPIDMRNATRSYSRTTFGENTTYICEVGFMLLSGDSSLQTTCSKSGNWTEPSQKCEVIDCGKPVTMKHAIKSYSRTTFGENTTYTCEVGFKFPSCVISLQTTCTKSGNWTKPSESCEGLGQQTVTPSDDETTYAVSSEEPDNEGPTSDQPTTSEKPFKMSFYSRVACRRFSPGKHVDFTSTGLNIGDSVALTCHIDYEMPEGGKTRTVVCQTDGHWSDNPQCKPMTCGAIPNLANAVPNTRETRVGTMVEYTCEGDLLFPSGVNWAEMLCTGQHVWYPPLEGCQVRCPPVAYLDHAFIDGPYTSLVDTVVNLQCHRGHRFPSTGSTRRALRCLASREWEDAEDCKADQCPALSIPDHAKASTTLVAYGTVATVTCDSGYQFVNGTTSMATRCTAKRVWNSTLPQCEEILCPPPPNVANSKTTGNSYKLGDIVSYVCNEKMRFADGVTSKDISCVGGGEWNETDLSCAADRCPPIPQPLGTVPMKVDTEKGAIATIQCQPGSLFNDSTVTRLTRCDGIDWDYRSGGCKPIICPALNSIPHATVDSDEVMFGSRVNVTCEKGYTLDTGPAFIAYCNESGQWEGLQNECQPVKCGKQPVVMYASSKVVRNAAYQTSINYTCKVGYWFRVGVFSDITNCTADGEWQPPLADCFILSCKSPPTWNGMVVNSTSRIWRSVVNTTCSKDKMFPGWVDFRVLTCGSNGEWQPAMKDCVDRVPSPKFSPQAKEASKSEVIGAVSLGLVVAVGVGIVVIDAPALYVAFQRLHHIIVHR